MGQKVKVAVLGYGHLGKWHCDKAYALESADFVAIVESYGPNQEKAKEKFPNIKVVSDISEIVNEIDAAVIATPTSTHFELTKYLLENKKHVFCEKPLCDNMKEVEQLQSLLTDELVLQVGHSERFHSIWGQVKDFINGLKSSYQIRINRVASFKGRATDVDVVQDLMIHDLDLLNYLTGKKPVKVKAYGNKIRTPKYDQANALFEYDNGIMAEIMASRNHVKEIRDVEIYSSKGCFYIDLFRNEISQAPEGDFSGEYVKTDSYEKRDHLLLEQENFYRSILDRKPAIIGYQDGKDAIELTDKVIESLDKGTEISI